MTISAAKKATNYKWDRENMCNLAIRVRKTYAEEIKTACKAENTTPSAVMRQAVDLFMKEYHDKHQQQETPGK